MILNKIRLIYNMTVLVVKVVPALLIYVASLGAINIDLRDWNGVDEGSGWPMGLIPGWSKHELWWYLSPRFLWRTE